MGRLGAGHPLLVLQKGIAAMHDHELRKISHEWICLHMEVPENIFAAPAANQIDDVSV